MLLQRRGGSSASSNPSDTSSYPTSPPSSTHTYFNNIPKIDGSEGGFIGLVVGLGVIFIISCTGVFFLLRNRKRDRLTKSGGWVRAPGEEMDDDWDASDMNQMKAPRHLDSSTPRAGAGDTTYPYATDPYSESKGIGAMSSVSTVNLQSTRKVSYDEPFVPPAGASSPPAVHSRDSMETVTTHLSGTRFRESM